MIKFPTLALVGLYLSGCTALSDQAAAPRDNAKLAYDVSEQIFADGLARGATIGVQAEAGVIVLRGLAHDETHATQIAESSVTVPGVSRVENRLRVESSDAEGWKPRRNLIEDVRVALELQLAGRGGRLLVEAEDGVVYLSGIVPNPRIKAIAYGIAFRVDGVVLVRDNLITELP